jgi:signal transduction histidine kinase
MPDLKDNGRWLEFQVHPFPSGASILFWDVTDRRFAEDAIDTAKQLLQSLVDAVDAEMLLLDERGVVVSVNRAWRASLGAEALNDPDAGVGSSYVDVCRKIMPDFDEDALEAALREIAAGDRPDFSQAYVVSTSAGLDWCNVRITPLRLGGSLHLIVAHEHINPAAGSAAGQPTTAEQLLSAQQEERERIAMELHDSTSQHLVALGLGVAQLRRLVKPGRGAQDVLEDMAHSVQEAVREIRILSYLIKSPALERHQLERTVRAFVAGFGTRTSLKTFFHAEGALDEVSAGAEHAVFRVVQEALANVYRHAAARSVEVELANRDGVVSLRIVDDGKGIAGLTGASGTVPAGVGITSMRTRVAQLGGVLDLSSSRRGTTVSATIPATASGPLGA